jgi:hypothetical protein
MSDSIQRAVQLAELLIQLRGNVARLESELATAKEDMRRVEQEDLPDLMQELGLETFKLKSGEVIEVKNEVECSISEDRRAAAHHWLASNGFGGLIKTEVVVKFGRDEHDAAVACAESVGGEMVERVHPMTLKSFIKEQMEAGKAIPFDTFGVRPFNKVKITLKK